MLVVLIIAILFILYFNSRSSQPRHTSSKHREQIIGADGEREAFDTLLELEEPGRILTNLYLPTQSGSTTEVDLIWICKQGIFVLEVKHFSGWIFGNERNQYWTQVLKGGLKNRFYNPIWQNKAHIAALRSLLYPTYMGKYFNVVVFSDHCTLKDVSYHSDRTMVVQQEELADYLCMMVDSLPVIISEQRIDAIASLLKQYKDTPKQVHHDHIQSIHQRYKGC